MRRIRFRWLSAMPFDYDIQVGAWLCARPELKPHLVR